MKLLPILALFFFISCEQAPKSSGSGAISPADTSKDNHSKNLMFDPTKLTENDKKVLEDFYKKRTLFDTYIKDQKLKLFTCPGCGYPTLTERGAYDICAICNWEDDYQDDKEADKVWGGPNGRLSLTENRINIGKVLIHYSDSLQTKINLDPVYVLETINFYDKKKQAIESRMSGNETLEHPLWKEWNHVEKELQMALCRDKLQ